MGSLFIITIIVCIFMYDYEGNGFKRPAILEILLYLMLGVLGLFLFLLKILGSSMKHSKRRR